MKKKNNTFKILGYALALGVSLFAYSQIALAQEIEVKDNASAPTPVDFPGRSTLTEVKEAPLPSLSDSVIKEPSPMERAESTKNLPSEQLLGRITSEVFHEMADLERGNVFLKLQAQREQLKNDLEKLKATYREARLAEIEKRENVIRSRVKWQQEQEQIRQEMAEKRLKTEMLEKQLEEQEMQKEDLLPLDDEEEVKKPADQENVDSAASETETKPADKEEVAEAVYGIQKIITIKGMKGNLTAQVVDTTGKKLSLKVGTVLQNGAKVTQITKTDIILENKAGKVERLNLQELRDLELAAASKEAEAQE